MQAWEYAIVTFDNGNFQGIYSKDGNQPLGGSDGYLVMKDLGAAGWEAVCMIPGPGANGMVRRRNAARGLTTGKRVRLAHGYTTRRPIG